MNIETADLSASLSCFSCHPRPYRPSSTVALCFKVHWLMEACLKMYVEVVQLQNISGVVGVVGTLDVYTHTQW